MATHDVTFRILGTLDPSLIAALQNAQKNIKNLSELGKNVNKKAVAQAQKLAASQEQLNAIHEYRKLQRAINQTSAARGNEMLKLSQLNMQQTQETQKLSDMQKGYKELAKAQRRMSDNARVQREGVDVARANLKSAKASGDVERIKAAQVALRQQQEAAKSAAAALKEVNSALKQGKAELAAQKNSVKSLNDAFNSSSKNVSKLRDQLTSQQAQLREAQNKLSAQGLNGSLAAHEMQLRAQIQQTTQALNAEIAALERRNQIHTNFQNAQQNLSNAYSNFQNAVDTAGTIMNPFVSATKTAMDFEYQMKRVQAVAEMKNIRSGNLKQVTADMKAFEAQAKALGAATEYTAVDIARAQYYFGKQPSLYVTQAA